MPAIAVGASARRGPRTRSTLSSASGKGQKIARCRIAVWSNYPQAGPAIRFVRVGTMDNPDLWPPDIHIFTSSKQPWVTLPAGAKAVPEFYDIDVVWPAESLERRRLMRAKACSPRLGFLAAVHMSLPGTFRKSRDVRVESANRS